MDGEHPLQMVVVLNWCRPRGEVGDALRLGDAQRHFHQETVARLKRKLMVIVLMIVVILWLVKMMLIMRRLESANIGKP